VYTVYWIHYNYETNIATQGYVGVTKNLKRRIKGHKDDCKCRPSRAVPTVVNERGTKDLVIETIAEGNKDAMYALELELRPLPDIGWNRRAGGYKTVHSSKSKTKISKANRGNVGRKGQHNTKSHIAKMVATRMAKGNYKHKEETKAKIAESTKYGKSHAAKKIQLTISGKKYSYDCIKECCDVHNLKYSTVRSRLRKSMNHNINGYAVEYLG
jgi:predicted GIY-YIG superfamily endonuclease